MKFYEILVPTISNEGKPFRTRYHRVWDEKVRKMTGGLTIISPIKGQWISPDGSLFKERMIPVRIACDADEISLIADITADHYKQLAIMYYLISNEIIIKNYDK